jgi:geranylgeranyl diphosphate synthase, type II
MNVSDEIARRVSRIEAGIDRHLPPAGTRPERLHAAMRYAVQGGGKRLRPMLVVAASELFEGRPAAGGPARGKLDPMPAAVAVECAHTYSLIHDDLPCMDDDDLRRGRPTVHKAYDEATALLAGDALLTFAFELIGRGYPSDPGHAIGLELADAAGSRRLIGGQMEDLLAERKADATASDLEFIHENKTAAMIEASLVIGAMIGLGPKGSSAQNEGIAILRRAGRDLGLAFQIVDDILDATSDTATLGKTAGKDAKAGKKTFATLHGVEASRKFANDFSDAAAAEFEKLPGAAPFLVALAGTLGQRIR